MGNSWTLDETVNRRVVITCPQDWKGPPQSHDGCLVLAHAPWNTLLKANPYPVIARFPKNLHKTCRRCCPQLQLCANANPQNVLKHLGPHIYHRNAIIILNIPGTPQAENLCKLRSCQLQNEHVFPEQLGIREGNICAINWFPLLIAAPETGTLRFSFIFEAKTSLAYHGKANKRLQFCWVSDQRR